MIDNPDMPEADEWAAIVYHFGLDDSFVYTDDEIADYTKLFRENP